jgi:hypothetical protein
VDAETRVTIRAKGQSIVGARHANAARRPPAVIPGDVRARDVRPWRRDLDESERGDEAIVGQCHTVS